MVEFGMVDQKWFNFPFPSKVLLAALAVQLGAGQENVAAHVIEIVVDEHPKESSQLQDLDFARRRTVPDVSGYEVVGVDFYELFDEETVYVFFGLAFEVFHEVVVEGHLWLIML